MVSGAADCPLNFPTISNAFHLDNYETHNLVPRLSPHRPLCDAGRLGRKKKKTRVTRVPAKNLFPSSPARFLFMT